MPVSPEFLRTRAKLAEFDNLISTLQRMRLEVEHDCTHEQIARLSSRRNTSTSLANPAT